MTASAAGRWWSRGRRRCRFVVPQPDVADGLRKRHEVITRRFLRTYRAGIQRKPDDLPPLRSAGSLRMTGAQIVGTRLWGRGQWAQHRRPVRVGIGERRHCGGRACGSGTLAHLL